MVEELEAADPLGALPEVALRDEEAERLAVLELERLRRRRCRRGGRRRRRARTAAGWPCSPARSGRARAWPSGRTPAARGSSGSATPSQVVSSFVQRVTQWMSVSTVLRGSALNSLPGQGERAVDLAPDLEVPGRQVGAAAPSRSGGPGTSSVRYWPGGMRLAMAGSCSRPPNSRSNMAGHLLGHGGPLTQSVAHRSDGP